MTWGISPVEFPPPSSDDFPDFLQWQFEGENLGGADVDTVNVTDGLAATRGVGEDANILTLSGDITPHRLTWREIDGDGEVTADDIDNGISMTANTGSPVLTVPEGVIPPGAAVLVFQKGAAQVQIMPSSALDILYPTDRFISSLAGQSAIVTLLGGPADTGEVILCGDMAPVTP